MDTQQETFQQELSSLINRHSLENGSNTPDFVLANFLQDTLKVYEKAVKARDDWYNRWSSFGEIEVSDGPIKTPEQIVAEVLKERGFDAAWLSKGTVSQIKEMMVRYHRQFPEKNEDTEVDLISFGNYLLSEEREQSVSETMLRSVTHADLANYKESQ